MFKYGLLEEWAWMCFGCICENGNSQNEAQFFECKQDNYEHVKWCLQSGVFTFISFSYMGENSNKSKGGRVTLFGAEEKKKEIKIKSKQNCR